MDLSYTRFDRDVEVTEMPADLAVLLVGVSARQAASVTAAVQARAERIAVAGPGRLSSVHPSLFAPVDGAFNGRMARVLMRWKEE